MAKITIYPHLAEVVYDIEMLEEFMKPLPPIIARQVGTDGFIINPGPAQLQVYVTNNERGGTTVLRQGENAIPIGRQPGEVIKFNFVTPEITPKRVAEIEEERLHVNDQSTDVLALKRTIRIVSAAINKAIPGLFFVRIKDKEALRIWTEASK